MRSAAVFAGALGLVAQQPAPAPAPAPLATKPPAVEESRKAIAKGLEFLVSSQNPDGSWGGTRNKTMTDGFANTQTHHAWDVATTGLVCTALVELGSSPEAIAACERGLDYVCANADVKRPADWDTDNTWSYVYGLQGIAKALAHPRYKSSPRAAAMRKAGETILAGLVKYQSDKGGWAYYADPQGAWLTGYETSFTTAAGVIALCDAKAAGFDVNPKMLARAVKAVEHCRLPSGAFTYEIAPIAETHWIEGINNVKGSLGRIQVCNLALLRGGGSVTPEQIRWGLDQFFEHHKFLDVGRMKPIPHEAYYQIAGYFYFFGHYYAARLLETMPPEARRAFAGRLQGEILKTIEKDGAMWDFYISSNTRPYGTAFGVLTLGATLTWG